MSKKLKTGNTSNVVEFANLDNETQDLIKKAVKAAELSYSPYSKFPVGAAVRCKDNTVYCGCNVENASYSLAICAERTAIVKAVSEGKREFSSIAVIGNLIDEWTAPCGACRQFICEFGIDISIYLTRPTLGQVLETSIKELLPYPFIPNNFFNNASTKP